jgi:predicted metal-dependent hydrolase
MPVIDTALSEALRFLRDDDSTDSRSISDREISKVAEDASAAYIERGVPLDESISKVARARGLAPNFIDRIAEAANLETYHALLKKAAPEDRAHIRFPMAKKAAICEAVASVGPEMSVKIAAARDESMFDYMGAPPRDLTIGVDYGNGFDKVAYQVFELSNQVDSDLPPHPKFARMVFEKLATSEQELAGDVMALRIERHIQAERFVKTAKTMLLNGDAEALKDVYRDAAHLGLDKLASDLISDAVDQVAAAMPWAEVKLGTAVDEEYLPDNFPGRIINGDQITLKLLRDVGDLDSRCYNVMKSIDALDNTRERMAVRVLDLSE